LPVIPNLNGNVLVPSPKNARSIKSRSGFPIDISKLAYVSESGLGPA